MAKDLKGLIAVRIGDLFRELQQHNTSCVIIMFDMDACQRIVVGSSPRNEMPCNVIDILTGTLRELQEQESLKPQLQIVR